ncbi:MAG: amidohydrolase [Oscillospiraceae bacterium]|nr:amidohydrolase [Oscillospiraceae bacterium]
MSTQRAFRPFADLIVHNAKIHQVDITIDEIRSGKTDFTTLQNGYAAVREGVIIAVGEGDFSAYRDGHTELLDAGGHVLLPGIYDSHMHAMFSGRGMLNIDMRGVPSKDAMLSMIAERVRVTPKGEFIEGAYWNQLQWGVQEIPTRRDLDAVSTEHPMFFMRMCFHIACVNSAALALAGITRATPDPEGGIIGRDANGEPNGILYENAAMGLVQSVIPPLGESQLVTAIEKIGAHLNQVGITSVIDANLDFDSMRAYFTARKQGKLTYRTRYMFYLDAAAGNAEYHLNRLDEMVAVTGYGDDMLKFNAIKVTLDGIPATGTAYMRRPYKHMPETSGYTTITPDEMRQVAIKGTKYHWQIGVHTIGDKAVDVALNAFEAADRECGGIAQNRPYLIHVPFPHDDQIERMKRLNVSVTLQPTILHLMGEGGLLYDDQARDYMPSKYFIDNGIVLGGSSDHPVVPCNPFFGMYAAMTRVDTDGVVWGAEHRISARQALIMWTKSSAYFSGEEDKLGSIEPGCYGDMVLIDRDILECTAEEVRDVSVLKTIVGGKVVYG